MPRQLELFRTLLGRDPTHLDSHQHVHVGLPAADVLVEIGLELGIPVRHLTESIHFLGDFYGQGDRGDVHPDAITVPNLVELRPRRSPTG